MSAAERKRRYRRRQRQGQIVLRLVVDEVAIVEALILSGHLAPCDGDDRRKIAAAMEQVTVQIVQRDASRHG